MLSLKCSSFKIMSLRILVVSRPTLHTAFMYYGVNEKEIITFHRKELHVKRVTIWGIHRFVPRLMSQRMVVKHF